MRYGEIKIGELSWRRVRDSIGDGGQELRWRRNRDAVGDGGSLLVCGKLYAMLQ